MSATWVAVVAASLLCLGAKVAGWSLPARVVARPQVQRVAALLPVAMLAALVVVQTVGGPDRTVVLDHRVVGLGAAAVLLTLRAPFLLVLLGAALVSALVQRA